MYDFDIDIYLIFFIFLGENMVPEQTDEAEAGGPRHARCGVFGTDCFAAGDVISAPRHERTARAPLLPRACTAAGSCATNAATAAPPPPAAVCSCYF